MAVQPASSVVVPLQDAQVGPGCRRRPTRPTAEGGFDRTSAPKPTTPKLTTLPPPIRAPIRRGPAPKPGAHSARLGCRPSPPLQSTSQPPMPELRAATAREAVYSRDGWQWEQDQRPGSGRTVSASVRLEPLRHEPEPEPEPEPELRLCMRPIPPQVSGKTSATTARPTAPKPLMLVGGAAPSARTLACAMPAPAQLPQPSAALSTVATGIDATPSTRDEAAAAGQLRSQKVAQLYRQQQDHRQPKQQWLYRNLDQPIDGAEAQRQRCDSTRLATTSVPKTRPLIGLGQESGAAAAVAADEAAEAMGDAGSAAAKHERREQHTVTQEAQKAQLAFEIESPALAKLRKARSERLRLAGEPAAEQAPADADACDRATQAVMMHSSHSPRNEAPDPLPLPVLSKSDKPSKVDTCGSSRNLTQRKYYGENSQQPVQLGQRWNQLVKPDFLGWLQLVSGSPFDILSGSQVVNKRGETELNSNSTQHVGGNATTCHVPANTMSLNTRRVTSDVRKPIVLQPPQMADSCATEEKMAHATAEEETRQQSVPVYKMAASKQSTPQSNARARAEARSKQGRGVGQQNRAAQQKLRPAHMPQCASPLVGW